MSQMNRVARVYDRALIEGLRRTAPERAKGVSLMRVWLTESEGRCSLSASQRDGPARRASSSAQLV
jgi:hypothetical protein